MRLINAQTLYIPQYKAQLLAVSVSSDQMSDARSNQTTSTFLRRGGCRPPPPLSSLLTRGRILTEIWKAGKPPDEPSSSRPTYLLDTMGKILEPIIIKGLFSGVESVGVEWLQIQLKI